jgi:hypothetical protein
LQSAIGRSQAYNRSLSITRIVLLSSGKKVLPA